jgi:hypothetical protein
VAHTALSHLSSSPPRPSTDITTDPTAATNGTFDKIIGGGDMAGLALADWLSDGADVRVFVVEAGADNLADTHES